MNLFEFDFKYGKKFLCGVDEAGRGPLAGPVVAAAAILKPGSENLIADVDDSKKFSEKKREQIYSRVIDSCFSYSVGICSPDLIDEVNILKATMIAMEIAVSKLSVSPEIVLVDGDRVPALKQPAFAIVKGDSKSASIAAASIIAKVTRDRIMTGYDSKYPGFNFKKNKGYGTKEHYESLKKFGVTEIHRLSFLKNLEKKQKSETVQSVRGKQGENVAFSWLLKNGFKPMERNYSSKYGEIDIIACREDYIYFIEVKLRKAGCGYSPSEAINLKKQKRLAKTAVIFLNNNQTNLQPKFAAIEVSKTKDENFFVNFIDDAFSVENEFELFKN